MSAPTEIILGEHQRTFDERFRLSIPVEMASAVAAEGEDCVLVKECPGCLSLWKSAIWQARLDAGVELVKAKIQAGRMEGRWEEVQLLGRLLSTRHLTVRFAGRGRLIVPEGFRDFLQVQPGSEVFVIGAAICIEIWHPQAWRDHLAAKIPEFRRLFDQLTS